MSTSSELKLIHTTSHPQHAGQGKGGGRKPSITPEKGAILLAALENGLTLKESLLQAEVSEDAYKRLLKKSEKFRTQIAVAKVKLSILAKAGMAKRIQQEDGAMIRWYLERKCPEEFSTRLVEDKRDNPLPEGTTIILPGSYPHPRIIPEGEIKESADS